MMGLATGTPTSDFSEDTLGIAMPHLGSDDHASVFLSRVRETASRNAALIDVSQFCWDV
jgi:hypothetical protein